MLGAKAPAVGRMSAVCRQAACAQRCRQVTTAALDELSSQVGRMGRERAGPARVLAPAAESMDATSPGSDLELEERPVDAQPMGSKPAGLPSWPKAVTLEDVTAPVATDVVVMNDNLRNIVANRHPRLQSAADHIFGAGGKKMRPVIVFLVARATAHLSGLRCTLAARDAAVLSSAVCGAGHFSTILDIRACLFCEHIGR